MKPQDWFDKNLPDLRRPLSQSGIVNVLHCQRFFLFRHKWGIVPKVKRYTSAPDFGRLVHRMMQVGRERIDEVREECIKSYNELVTRIDKGEDIDGQLAMAAKDIGTQYDKAKAVCTIFWDKFPPKDYIKTLGREVVVESTYKAPLQGREVPLVGVIDWPVEDTRTNHCWLRDTKTTSLSFALKVTGLEFSIQSRFYRLLTHRGCEWGGKVKGFILDMLKTPTIKLCGKDVKEGEKKGITPEEAYRIRVEEWYETQDEAMESRALIFLNEPVENPELMAALNMACRAWLAPAKPEIFPRDITNRKCTGFRSQCPYYNLCSSAVASWPAQIEQDFKIREDSAGAQEKGEQDEQVSS